ncbi:IclR helix-turn-helix domain-containing protein [Granulicella pectinivorans]|jgi:hypothetical protein|uniref:IclR helix-turn-helix domain-containing protein n=1 Tax=Granulicella pectinivorans TaxID=474950 RepID=A0A1I6L0J3_9BACT|nr:helix-turn-helix domain-containing protein [Granulicella pectinivorans]SFR96985.1 IclR helix-turn-helix domain-containing protein [Granulicella pectinivorans]
MREALPKPRFHLDDLEIVKASRSQRSMDQHPDVDRSYIVPVLLKAFNVIDRVQHGGPSVNVKSIARELGYSYSTVYRIVRTLVACGYLGDREVIQPLGRRPRRKA